MPAQPDLTSAQALTRTSAAKPDAVLSLDLSRNRLKDVGVEALAGACSIDSIVVPHTLRLGYNQLGPLGLPPLTDALSLGHAATLKVLDLSNNPLGDQGIDVVVGWLAALPEPSEPPQDPPAVVHGLKELQVRNAGFGSRGAIALAGIAASKTPQVLDVSWNQIRADGAAQLVSSTMTGHLLMEGCALDDAAGQVPDATALRGRSERLWCVQDIATGMYQVEAAKQLAKAPASSLIHRAPRLP